MKKAEDYLTADFSLIVPPNFARFLELKADLDGNYRTRIKKDRPALYQFLLAVRLSAVSASGNKIAAPQDDRPLFLTTAEAAAEIGKSARCVRQWCKTGHLQAQRRGRDWMIRRVDLEALKASM